MSMAEVFYAYKTKSWSTFILLYTIQREQIIIKVETKVSVKTSQIVYGLISGFVMCGWFNMGQTENGKLLFTTHLLQKNVNVCTKYWNPYSLKIIWFSIFAKLFWNTVLNNSNSEYSVSIPILLYFSHTKVEKLSMHSLSYQN